MTTKSAYDPAVEKNIADTMRRLGSGCTGDQLKVECGIDDNDLLVYGDKARKRAMSESVTALKVRPEKHPPLPSSRVAA